MTNESFLILDQRLSHHVRRIVSRRGPASLDGPVVDHTANVRLSNSVVFRRGMIDRIDGLLEDAFVIRQHQSGASLRETQFVQEVTFPREIKAW